MIIKVDHRSIRIVGVPANGKNVGVFKDQECLIEIVAEQSPQQQADTLIHELLHAIWATRSFPPRMSEESLCTRMASALATLLRDNPYLAMWLEQALVDNVPIVTTEGE